MSDLSPWCKSFQLDDDGRPTGRWRWVIQGIDGDYFYPHDWLPADATTPPLGLLDTVQPS